MRIPSLLPVGLIAAAMVVLAVVGTVSAANPGKERIALTPAGNAQAKAEVLQRADLGSGWSGGFKRPDLPSTFPCSNYHPKQSDLVLIGAAQTTWDKGMLEVDDEAQVLRTAAMVRRDWRRTVTAPQVVPCLRQSLAKTARANHAKIVSFGRVAFPQVATYARAFRAVLEKQGIPIEIEFLLFGAGRSERSLTVTGLKSARASLTRLELRLGRLLAHRLPS